MTAWPISTRQRSIPRPRLNAEILHGNPLVVELAKADRWNGALPQTLLEGTGGMPLVGLPRPETAGATK
jgi:hypothetical protein